MAPRPNSKAAGILLRNADKFGLNEHSYAAPATAANGHAQPPAQQHSRDALKRRSPFKSRSATTRLDSADVHMRPASSSADGAAEAAADRQTRGAFAGLRLSDQQDPFQRSLQELRRVDAEKDQGNTAFSAGLHLDAARHYSKVSGQVWVSGYDL